MIYPQIFRNHNIENIEGVQWICQYMGIDEDDFDEAIASFNHESKRLRKVQ